MIKKVINKIYSEPRKEFRGPATGAGTPKGVYLYIYMN